MGSEADLHGSVLGKDHVYTSCDEVGINRPTRTIERKPSANRTGVSQQGNHGSREPKACPTPYSSPTVVRTALPRRGAVDSSVPIKVQRCGRQEDFNGRHGIAPLGRYGMGAAFGIELQMTPRSGIDPLQAGLNLAGRTLGKFQLLKCEAELPVPPEVSGRNRFRDDPL